MRELFSCCVECGDQQRYSSEAAVLRHSGTLAGDKRRSAVARASVQLTSFPPLETFFSIFSFDSNSPHMKQTAWSRPGVSQRFCAGPAGKYLSFYQPRDLGFDSQTLLL